jgi:YVTN family beta-propeller protein
LLPASVKLVSEISEHLIADFRMTPDTIVDRVDVSKDHLPSLLTGDRAVVMQAFRFERAKEVLYRCIERGSLLWMGKLLLLYQLARRIHETYPSSYFYGRNAARCLRFCAVILSVMAGTAHAAPFAYITNRNSNNISLIDAATNTVVATVAVGTNPLGVAVNLAGTRAYVANFSIDNVSVIDTATNTAVTTVSVGTGPAAFGLFIGGPKVAGDFDGDGKADLV